MCSAMPRRAAAAELASAVARMAALWGAALCSLMCQPALAGRPMSMEDAQVNMMGVCQVESWVDAEADAVTRHVSPACGIHEGLEMGLEASRATPADMGPSASVSLKWVPLWANAAGWQFGAKAETVQQRGADAHWLQGAIGWTAIATRPVGSDWTLHLNLARAVQRLARPVPLSNSDEVPLGAIDRSGSANRSFNAYAAGLAWTPHPRWLVFAEISGETRRTATQATGARWWLVPDRVGLDLTAGRTNATPASRAWGVGLGWYGLYF